MNTLPRPLPAVGASNWLPSRVTRLVGSSTNAVEVADVELMLPGKALKFTRVLLYEKLVFIIQRFARRLRPVSSKPLNVFVGSPSTLVNRTIVGRVKVGW